VIHSLHQLLERAAHEHPGAVAVVDGDREVPYAELDAMAGQVAAALLAHGVRRGDRVGLYLPKSVEAVAGIYGVLRAGAAYVPLDPDAPAARLALMLADCGVETLLTSSEVAERWSGLIEGRAPLRNLVVLDRPPTGDARTGGGPPGSRSEDPAAPPGLRITPASRVWGRPAAAPVRGTGLDLAYVLYTSGSTGMPKGVMLSHHNALAFVEWAVGAFGVTAGDRLGNHAPLHFDLSVFDLFAAAYAAAAVVLVPRRAAAFPPLLARLTDEARVTVWYSVPSTLTLLATRGGLQPGALPRLRTVLFAGEVFPLQHLRRLRELLPHARFVNLYGPTETNVCTWYEVPPLGPGDGTADRSLPIGSAIDGVEVLAVREDGAPCGPGEIGELLVRGPTVMHGYWGDAERTSLSLVPHPEDLPGPVYRTGDLVTADADGVFSFIGRRDAQVKSRGYRIELGEVEHAVGAHPDVVECAVVAVPDELLTNRLKAYVVARDGLDSSRLVDFCAKRLPAYMLPSEVAFVAALPKTSTGKTDRGALI
jgi:amino acid adenylation domain-containing protein